jgi:cytochrome c-type biogenesis protein CcmH
MMTGGHCEEPLGRRGNLGPKRMIGARLLRFARNDILSTVLGIAIVVMTASPAQAVRPDEMLSDPGLEARAREVGRELRCLVCRNQSIDDSDADLAHDLRVLVRERITAGDSDDRVIAYVRARYGDFVLLRPPLELGTLLLWGGPLLILVIGGLAIARFYRTRREDPVAPLSPDERRRLASVLGAPPPFPPPLAGEGQGGV